MAEDLITEIEKELKRAFPKKTISVIAYYNSFKMELRIAYNFVFFTVGKKWLNVDPEIAIGYLHLLLKKVRSRLSKRFKIDESKINLALNFLKHYSDVNVDVNKNDPMLQESYDRLNKIFFNNELSPAKLRWSNGIKTLGSYNYFTNTIRISKILKNVPKEVLDYVMYHEMLHKYLKFKYKRRINYHTREFKELETKFPNAEKIEKFLTKLVQQEYKRRKKRKK